MGLEKTHKRFNLPTITTMYSDTYSLHMHRISSFKKGRTEVDKARPLGAYLMI